MPKKAHIQHSLSVQQREKNEKKSENPHHWLRLQNVWHKTTTELLIRKK